MSSEIDALENIGSLALAANKLGMGVNISGKISHNNIRDIAAVNYIEDIVIGKPVLGKAVLIGIEQTMRDLLALIGM